MYSFPAIHLINYLSLSTASSHFEISSHFICPGENSSLTLLSIQLHTPQSQRDIRPGTKGK